MALAKKIDHLGIAVRDVDAAVATFTKNFGFPVEVLGDVPQLNIRRAHLRIGSATLELFSSPAADHPVSKFLAERGEGLYLLSLEVDDLEAAASALKPKGIDVRIQDGPEGMKLGFIAPRHTHGVLLQLVQRPN